MPSPSMVPHDARFSRPKRGPCIMNFDQSVAVQGSYVNNGMRAQTLHGAIPGAVSS